MNGPFDDPDEHDQRDDKLVSDEVREQLRYWPYTIHQIDDTLDLGLIEGRGRQLLFQAINARNLTAFVGSGLSAAYGRLTWSGWENEQFSVVEDSANAFEELAKSSVRMIQAHLPAVNPETSKSYDPAYNAIRFAIFDKDKLPQQHRYNIWRWLRYRERQISSAWNEMRRLRDTFRRTKGGGGQFPGGEPLPVKFQIAQQLHNQLRQQINIFMPPREISEPRDIILKKAWPGARIDRESAAPEDALEVLQQLLARHPVSLIEQERGDYEEALSIYSQVFLRPQANVSAEELAKMLLYDERAHAMITLRDGLTARNPDAGISHPDRKKVTALETALKIYDRDALKRNVAGIRDDPDRFRILSAYRFDALKRLRDTIESGDNRRYAVWKDFIAVVDGRLKAYFKKIDKSGDDRRFLTPSSRFLTATYLNLIDDPWSLICTEFEDDGTIDTKKLIGERDDNGVDTGLLPALQRGDFVSRRSIIANRFDPLPKTVRQLGINRYITMNYDMEIERFFQDMGYRKFGGKPEKPEPPDRNEYRSDPIGGVLIDQTFNREQASELVAFAVGDNRKDASVFHLHGRATESDNLVVTERDYMNLYLFEDRYRDTVNEAITMAFSSSPLVFLGLGMNEADLLRPLRQFMSNRDRTIGYHAVAILPAEQSIEARTKFSVTSFLRYGVHTIFYGSGQVTFDPAPGEKYEKQRGLDWLCRVLLLTNALSSEVSELRKGQAPADAPTLLARMCKTVGVVSDDIGDYPDDALALMALFGKVVCAPSGDLDQQTLRHVVAPYAQEIVSGKLKLRVCAFTPIRPKPESANSAHFDKSVFIDGDDYVGFATAILNESFRILLRIDSSGASTEHDSADLAALQTTLSGLFGAFLTGALNAQLVAIGKEWRAWWKRWQQSPPHRFARLQHLTSSTGDRTVFEPARYVRHRVDSIITNIAKQENIFCNTSPFEPDQEKGSLKLKEDYQTRIRAYDTFLLALRDSRASKMKSVSDSKRVLITVAAFRGLGKGTFLTAMSSRLGLSVYSKIMWPHTKGSRHSEAFLAAACFINLSYSTEIASCFDGLVRALKEICPVLQAAQDDLEAGGSQNRIRDDLEASLHASAPGAERPYNWQKEGNKAHNKFVTIEKELVGVSRALTIKTLLKLFKTASEGLAAQKGFGRPRLLLYLSGLELIYKPNQYPKNREIKALFDGLFDVRTNAYPLDIIFVGSERGLGHPFSLPFLGNQPGESSGEAQFGTTPDPEQPAPHDPGGRPFQNVSLQRDNLEPHAREHVDQRIAEGRLKIDVDVIDEQCAETEEGAQKLPDIPVNYVHYCRPVSPASLLVDNFPVLATALYLVNPPGKPEDTEDTEHKKSLVKAERAAATKAFDEAVLKGRKTSDDEMLAHWQSEHLPSAEALEEARSVVWATVKEDCEEKFLALGRLSLPELRPKSDMEDLLRYRLKLDHSGEREEWRRIRRSMGYNRFTITILMAAAEQIVIQEPQASKGGERAQEFIRDVIDQVRNVGMERREELILQAVIERYRRYHLIGDADLDTEFHQIILRHLGVIGSPTNSAVLVRLPEFRDYFQRIGIELQTSRRRFLTRALTVLAYRGLIFRLDPHPRLVTLAEKQRLEGREEDDKYWPADQDFRYALHRTVQRYALSKMGVDNVDPIRNNSFAPRLYTSMPSIGTGLSVESYGFLRALIIGLSQYPDVPAREQGLRPWLFTTKHLSVRVQALRAALSLARSTMSVATLSRFASRFEEDRSVSRIGLLENYKIRLRWIIRMAWELVPNKSVEDPKAEYPHINPLYRDEIIWLYNELGVISLTQGNLTEALGFLRQAAELNEDVEGRARYGPIYDYIDLNHAIVQFERGRLASAKERLRHIVRSATDEPLMHTIARGYLCVIDHIQGRFDGLRKRFDEVVAKLQEQDDSRATAIFMSHRARFLAAIQIAGAGEKLALARSIAETAGHEDIRHHILLSQLTVQHRERLETGKSSSDGNALQQLRDIEYYGRRMGIWSLQVDALKLSAEILLSEGETSSAGAMLVRSMAIAKRNRMMLRLNSGLTLYSRILLKRNDLAGAARHAQLSLEMAKGIGYSVQTSSAQSILAEVDPNRT